MKEHLPASVSLFLWFHLPMSCAGSFSSKRADKALRHREVHGSTSDVPLNSAFFSSIRSGAHKVPKALQLTSGDLHYLGMCRKVMSHGLLYLPYPGQMAHHPLCHHFQGFLRGQGTETWRAPEVLTIQYFETNETEGCSAALNHRPLCLKVEHPKLGDAFKNVPYLLSTWSRLWQRRGRLKISTLKSLYFCCSDVFSFCKAIQERLFPQSFRGNSACPLPCSFQLSGIWKLSTE